MRVYLLLAPLFVCGLTVVSQLPDPPLHSSCVSELEENIDFPGSDVTQILSPDVEHCQLACTQHPSCLFFTFVQPNWTGDKRQYFCYLKNTPSRQPNTKRAIQGVTSGYSLKACETTPDFCPTNVYHDVDFTGSDFSSIFTADYEECQRVCTNEPGCKFFTYLTGSFSNEKQRYKCYLKYSSTVPRPTSVRLYKDAVSGFSPKKFSANGGDTKVVCQRLTLTNTDIPGNDIEQVFAASPEHCRHLCSVHPRCTYFSYQRNKCYLKRNTDLMATEAKQEVVSGTPMRFCQLPNDWATVAYEGLDFPGSDRQKVLLDSPELCHQHCATDPQCQFYTHYRGDCYLKQVMTIPLPPKMVKMANVVSGFSLDC